MSPANQCPVCQARFRGARVCSRCGADLEPLMALAAEAWRLRQGARDALLAGDAERGLGLARKAQEACGTPAGESLRLLCAWMAARGAGSRNWWRPGGA